MRQPLPFGPTATANAQGQATFSGISPSVGAEWVVTFSVPGAPGGAIFTLYQDASLTQAITDWVGKNKEGPYNVTTNQQIVVVGQNLTPGAQYQLTLTGTAYVGEEAPLVNAQSTASNNLTTTQFLATINRTAAPGTTIEVPSGGFQSLTYPPGTTALSFHAAILPVLIAGCTAGDILTAWLQDASGGQAFLQQIKVTAADLAMNTPTVTFVFPVGAGNLGNLSGVWIQNGSSTGTLHIDLILDQEPIITATLIAGVLNPNHPLSVDLPNVEQVDATAPPPPEGVQVGGHSVHTATGFDTFYIHQVGLEGAQAPTEGFAGLLISGRDSTLMHAIAVESQGVVASLLNVLLAGGIDAANAARLLGIAVAGAAVPTNVLFVGGSDGTDIRAFATDTHGNLTPFPYPSTSTPLSQAAAHSNAICTVTFAAVAAKTNYVSGFQITASGSTAALVVQAQLTGVLGGPLSFAFVFLAGVGVQCTPLTVNFDPPLPASAVDTAVTLSLPAGGAGNALAAVNMQGFVM